MELLVFGHGGTPVLVFPSSMGRFHEWEDFGMMDAVADKIGAGYNQFFCVDSVDKESLYNKGADPYVRIVRHRQYMAYIHEEVVPYIHMHNPNRYLITTGASFGAYHAFNAAFQQPHKFGKLIAMAGKYDIRGFLDGFYDDNVYFNNPVDYVPGLRDHFHLEALRRLDIRLVTGENDICRDAAWDMSAKLGAKGILHQLDEWKDGTAHDWPWWRAMIRKHL